MVSPSPHCFSTNKSAAYQRCNRITALYLATVRIPSRQQWNILYTRMLRSLRLMGRLRARLCHLGWRPDHPYYRAVEKAHNAVHDLTVHTFYAGCESGVYDGGSMRYDDDPQRWCGDGI